MPKHDPNNTLVIHIHTALEDIKAQDITQLDVSELTSITDYMIICTGTSNRHVKAIAHRLIDGLKKIDIRPLGVEGENEGEWILVNYGDAIVHIMQASIREFYDLESLWVVTQQKLAGEAGL